MKAPEDRAAGPGPAHWPMDTAQVHWPHTNFNNSYIDDWSSAKKKLRSAGNAALSINGTGLSTRGVLLFTSNRVYCWNGN